MKTKKRIASKLFAALVVLTLISCCFLGTTFARYTTGSSNTAQVTVAKWDVDMTAQGEAQQGSTVLSFDKLSPNVNENGATDSNLTNSTGRTLVATLTVSEDTDVNVNITIELGDVVFLNSLGTEIGFGTDGKPSYNDCSGVFSIKFYDGESGGEEIFFSEGKYTKTVTAGTGLTLNIYAEVTWTTYYEANSPAGISSDWTGKAGADKLDTWIGENIASLNWSLTYTAVQSSELPTA